MALLPCPQSCPMTPVSLGKRERSGQDPAASLSSGAQQPECEGALQILLLGGAQPAPRLLPQGLCGGQRGEVRGGGELGGRGAGGRARAPRVEPLPAIAAPPGTAERGPSLSFPARAAGSPFASIRISPTPTRASWLSTSPMTPVTVSDWLYKGAPAERGWPGTDFLFCVL